MIQNRSVTVKVGILTILSISLLIFVLIWLRGRGITSGESHTVLFNDVDGMREGAPVQFMGIRVGFVDQVLPMMKNGKYYVKVIFTINKPDIKPPKGSVIAIDQSGLIGEKFIEITPPVLQSATITSAKPFHDEILMGSPIQFLYEDGLVPVGQIEKVEKLKEDRLYRYKLSFRVTLPGAVMPDKPVYELVEKPDHSHYSLRILPEVPIITQVPDKNLLFTIENPLRMKRFLEIQLESAEALKITNEKVNQLLSDDSIQTLKSTLKNTEQLTAQASQVMESANHLLQTSSRDLEKLVLASNELASNVSVVTKHVNEIIGNPELKADIVSTVASIEQSTRTLNEVLKDPALKETLTLTRDTSKSAAELVEVLRKTAQDKDVQARLDGSLTALNESLNKLSVVLNTVETVTNDKDQTLKGIIHDTRSTTENLKRFSEKLNGRFLLFRLMF